MARTGLSSVLAVGEFRAIWVAELLSVLGDQVARVALAVLVYGRTGSGALAAAAYALTYLPALVGGLLLGWTADRFRRRTVLVACDLLRAAAIAAMALPGMPLAALGALLVGVVLLGAPHNAAQAALMPDILDDEAYDHGLAVRQMTIQTGQFVGFALGGLLVAAVDVVPALLLDAATFVGSAALLRLGLGDRPPPEKPAAATGSGGRLRSIAAGVAEIARDPQRRVLVALAWTVGWFVVPEGLAAPYAAQLGADPGAVGLLMAADPLGSILGAWLFVRFVPAQTRERLVGVLAVAAGLPLLVTATTPDVPVTVLLWGVSGLCSTAYLLQTQAGFVRATPEERRGAAIGAVASGIVAAQGMTMLIGGLLADALDAARAVAICGAIGSLLALFGALRWWVLRRGGRTGPAHHG